MLQKLSGSLPVGRVHELGDGELAGAVDGHDQVELSFSCLRFGNVDVEEADGIALELLSLRLVAVHLRQARDAVALEAPMQGRARHPMRHIPRLRSGERVRRLRVCIQGRKNLARRCYRVGFTDYKQLCMVSIYCIT